MGITPTDAEMIADALDSRLIDVHVGLPGMIQSYDADTQTATVELQVNRVLPTSDGKFATEELPVLENIPVEFPRTKKFMITFPLEKGDFGRVFFNEMSIDQWRSKGEITSPGDIGRHTLTGGVFIPGLMPNSEAVSGVGTDMVLGEIAGVQVRVKPGGPIEVVSGGGPTADDFVAMAGKTQQSLDDILAIFSQGVPSPPDGGAALQTAWIAAAALVSTAVESSNLKADD